MQEERETSLDRKIAIVARVDQSSRAKLMANVANEFPIREKSVRYQGIVKA
jgi:hypothetical protein